MFLFNHFLYGAFMKKIGLVFSLFLFFSISYQVNAQWELQNPKITNLDIFDVFYTDSINVFAVGENALILRSTNAGLNWQKIIYNSDKDFTSIYFLNSALGWIVSNEGLVIKTTDRGLTWNEINIAGNKNYYSVCFINEQKGFIGSDSGLLLTTSDGGNSWQSLQTQLNFEISDIHFVSGNVGFIQQKSGNYLNGKHLITFNGGIEWAEKIFQGFAIVYFVDEYIGYAADQQTVYKTTDTGNTWQTVFSGFISPSDIFFINDQLGWIKDKQAKIFITTNGGTNWVESKIPIGNYYSSYKYKVRFASPNNGVLVGPDGSTFISDDGGYSWDNAEATTVVDLTCIDFITTQIGFAAGSSLYSSSIIKTTDAGINWYKITEIDTNYFITLLSLDFFNEYLGIATGGFGYAIKTTDGGISWNPLNINSTDDFSDIKIFNSSTYLIAGRGNVYKTTDSGLNWTTSQTSSVEPLYFNFIDDYIGYAITQNGVIFKSTDQGTSWNLINIIDFIQYSDFISEEIGFVAGFLGSIKKTIDGGLNWIDISSSEFTLNFRDVDFVNENYGWCLYDNSKVIRTTNSGLNWVLQNLEGNNRINKIFMLDENTGWIIGNNGIVLHTTNGGVTFIEEENNFAQPKQFLLQQNYPNPFNPSTKISWQSPVGSWQTLKVYDILGNEVATLVDEYRNAGSYNVEFRMQNVQLSSGVYFYQLRVGDFVKTKKMVLLK
jgi:photosystem II stability/assembly factor-like uncharacterized protein